jgi:hypothetical protein
VRLRAEAERGGAGPGRLLKRTRATRSHSKQNAQTTGTLYMPVRYICGGAGRGQDAYFAGPGLAAHLLLLTLRPLPLLVARQSPAATGAGGADVDRASDAEVGLCRESGIGEGLGGYRGSLVGQVSAGLVQVRTEGGWGAWGRGPV